MGAGWDSRDWPSCAEQREQASPSGRDGDASRAASIAPRVSRPRARTFFFAGLLLLGAPLAARAEPLDPVLPLIQRMDAFLHRGETDGVTRDPRRLQNPPEEIRLSVIPQLLGYCELSRVFGGTSTLTDVRDRADFLLDHLSEATSNTAFDGMLAFALLDAHAVTGDPRYRAAAEPYLARFRAMRGAEVRLNWGLMAAMALAEDARATGNPASLAQVRSILSSLVFEQQFDGSFPHYCYGTRDVHYSAWMAMELIVIGERLQDPTIDRVLSSVNGFLQGRVDLAGVTRYEEPGPLGGRAFYYSRGGGCPDYDTRGWVNELGYTAKTFDRFQDPRYHAVMERLRQLEDHGAFADKYGYPPETWDPVYPWASEPRSVIRTSVVFWSLASLYADRVRRGPARYASPSGPVAQSADEVQDAVSGEKAAETWGPPQEDLSAYVAHEAPAALASAAGTRASRAVRAEPGIIETDGLRLGSVTPNPARGACSVALRLPSASLVRFEVFDAAGRRVRTFAPMWLPAGASTLRWDGRDGSGVPAEPGLYLLRAAAGDARALAKVAIAP